MTDIAALQSDIMAQVSGAADEAALEAVRVATLGKKGSVSALLATMGKLTPDERKVQGPLFNGLRDAVTDAIAARKIQLADAALETRLAGETAGRHPARAQRKHRQHPSRSARCWTKWSPSLPTWALASPKVPTWSSTITTSPN